MMSDMVALLVFLASAAVLGWLAARASGKWPSVILAGSLSIVLVLGFATGLIDTIQLYAPASNPVANDQVTGTSEQIARGEEFAGFCEGSHSTNPKLPVGSGVVAVSSDTALVFIPSEIFHAASDVDAQKIVAYSQSSGPDLEVVVSNWSATDFVTAIREGKDPRGHALAHGMPWRDIAAFATDEDLETYYTYLRALTPIHASAK